MDDHRQSAGRRQLPDDDEHKAGEMVSGQADPARHRFMIAAGWCRAALRMSMPVADIVQFTREHGVDLGLLASAVGSEKEAPSSVVGPRCGRLAHHNALPVDPGEKLAAGFTVPKAKLAMLCKMSEHSRLKMDYLARRADRIV